MAERAKRLVCGFLVVLAFSASADAQWLNYKTPGVPRTADGKPKLDAPAPRTPDGRPDLSGVWMHELTPAAEVQRLFGPRVAQDLKVYVPGMEIGTQHKYFFDILADFKAEDSPLKPEIARRLREQAAAGPPPNALCAVSSLPIGFPLQGLLSEPIKIVQAPRLT